MADYPDWTRLFQLAGTEITIPINIEASDVTLSVSIDAVTATVDVNIAHSDVLLFVRIQQSFVTLDVNIESQTANITFEFADQSVAVFDAAKWFAHEAEQVFNRGTATVPQNTLTTLTSRTVPTGETFYIAGMSFGLRTVGTPDSCKIQLALVGVNVIDLGSLRGGGLIFDVPIRAATGQAVVLSCYQYNSGGDMVLEGGFWGWDEED